MIAVRTNDTFHKYVVVGIVSVDFISITIEHCFDYRTVPIVRFTVSVCESRGYRVIVRMFSNWNCTEYFSIPKTVTLPIKRTS